VVAQKFSNPSIEIANRATEINLYEIEFHEASLIEKPNLALLTDDLNHYFDQQVCLSICMLFPTLDRYVVTED